MFRSTSAAEDLVKKATDEKLTTENWELNLNICDHVTSPEDAHEYFKAINKRMLHRNANVLLYTLSLVDALVKNCSEYAKPEVASRAFTTTLVRVLNDKGIHEEVKTRILGYIQQWAFEFRQESNLSLMEETYRKLRSEGMRFPQPQKPEKIPKASEQDLKKEEDDLQLALALSLSDYQSKADKTTSHIREEIKRQAHISGSQRPGEAAKTSSPPKPLKVRALYDFKATEAGELGFYKGDVIEVLDQKFRDWWKGRLHGQTGIFPANFVQMVNDSKSMQSSSTSADTEEQIFGEAANVELLLRKLSRIDPRRENLSENEEIQIVKLIEEYAEKKERLEGLRNKILHANQTYNELMANVGHQPHPTDAAYGSEQYLPRHRHQQQQQQQQQQHAPTHYMPPHYQQQQQQPLPPQHQYPYNPPSSSYQAPPQQYTHDQFSQPQGYGANPIAQPPYQGLPTIPQQATGSYPQNPNQQQQHPNYAPLPSSAAATSTAAPYYHTQNI